MSRSGTKRSSLVTRNIRNNDLREHAVERLIFALDIGTGLDDALLWVERLKGHVGLFKVGKESFTHYGPEVIRQILSRGGRVFLDLKYHDIPNTVAMAAVGAVRLGVSMFNVHALGGKKMMLETVGAVRHASEQLGRSMPVMLAVTVLTSLNDGDLRELGFIYPAGSQALNLAKMAQDSGMTGVVASPQDILAIRKSCGKDFVIVTPGIRGAGEVSGDDQKRTLTATEAVVNGADYLVVGRPIRIAQEPAAAAEQIIMEISAGLSKRKNLKDTP